MMSEGGEVVKGTDGAPRTPQRRLRVDWVRLAGGGWQRLDGVAREQDEGGCRSVLAAVKGGNAGSRGSVGGRAASAAARLLAGPPAASCPCAVHTPQTGTRALPNGTTTATAASIRNAGLASRRRRLTARLHACSSGSATPARLPAVAAHGVPAATPCMSAPLIPPRQCRLTLLSGLFRRPRVEAHYPRTHRTALRPELSGPLWADGPQLSHPR